MSDDLKFVRELHLRVIRIDGEWCGQANARTGDSRTVNEQVAEVWGDTAHDAWERLQGEVDVFMEDQVARK